LRFSIRLDFAQDESPTPRRLFKAPLARRLPRTPSALITSVFWQQATSPLGQYAFASSMEKDCWNFGSEGPRAAPAAATAKAITERVSHRILKRVRFGSRQVIRKIDLCGCSRQALTIFVCGKYRNRRRSKHVFIFFGLIINSRNIMDGVVENSVH
jgi:hypothetical protein